MKPFVINLTGVLGFFYCFLGLFNHFYFSIFFYRWHLKPIPYFHFKLRLMIFVSLRPYYFNLVFYTIRKYSLTLGHGFNDLNCRRFKRIFQNDKISLRPVRSYFDEETVYRKSKWTVMGWGKNCHKQSSLQMS